MLLALNLASNPATSHLRGRRGFYERAKKKFSELENSKENSEYYETFQPNQQAAMHTATPNSTTHSFSSTENSSNCSKIQSKLSHYFNEDVVVDLLDSVSPASIHRKDSYRRAQEHKLFLENNPNVTKASRPVNGKRVKNILNESKCSIQYGNMGSSRAPEMSFIDSSQIRMGCQQNVTSQNNFQKVFANNLYDVKNFKDEMLLDANKTKSVSPNEIIGFEANNMEEKLKIETCNSVSNFKEQNDIEHLNKQIKNTEISIKGN